MIGLVLAALWTLTGGAAWAVAPSPQPDLICHSAGLSGARLTTSLTFHHRRQDVTRVTTTFTAVVPTSWAPSADLLLSPDADAYRDAMGCLLRGTGHVDGFRPTEWRHHPPKAVTLGPREVQVSFSAEDWLSGDSAIDVGMWRVTLTNRTYWSAELSPPDTLRHGIWSQVRVDLGGPRPQWVSPTPPVVGGHRLEWSWKRVLSDDEAVVPVRVDFRPPAPQAFAADATDRMMDARDLTGPLWNAGVLGLVVLAVRPLRRPRTPHPALGRQQRTAIRVAVRWTLLALAVSAVTRLDDIAYRVARHHLPDPASAHGVVRWAALWSGREARGEVVQAVLLGLALCLYGRPRRSVLAAAGATAAAVGAVAVRPSLAGLSPDFTLPEDAAGLTPAIAWLVALDAGIIFLWLIGFAACAQYVLRSARQEGLELRNRNSRAAGRPVPVAARRETLESRFRLRTAGSACAAVAAAVSLWTWQVAEWNWRRSSWLDDTTAVDYAQRHASQVVSDMGWLAWEWQDWVDGYDWIVIGLALAAVLAVFGTPAATADTTATAPAPPHSAGRALPPTAEQPWPLTRVVVVFGAVTFVSFLGPYLGFDAAWVSLPLCAATPALLLAWGRRSAVLRKRLQPTGPRIADAIAESDRRRWLESARGHLELQQELAGLDREQSADALDRRRRVQRLITRRHRWHVGSRYPQPRLRLPAGITPVDVALGWGPRATWLGNAVYAAAVAALAGLPATLLVLVIAYTGPGGWSTLLGSRFGVFGILTDAVAWECTWAAAGFFFGAMHRLLPGRRGYTRALAMWLVLVIPVALDSLITYLLAEDPYMFWLISQAALLPLLTVTGIAMDMETFRGERLYWRSRPKLLLSVYQWRSASVQIAFTLAQLVAVVGLWQQLKGGGGSAPSAPSPP